MPESMKIAQENFNKKQKELRASMQTAFWDGFCRGIEKAIIATCTVSLVLDAILLISLALDRLMH